MIVALILSGGSGTRLWPVSREADPKPFMKLPDGETLLAKTFARAAALRDVAEVITITNREYYFRSNDELRPHREAKPALKSSFLLEPIGRNTAPAVAIGALAALERHGEGVCLLVLPADHLIRDQAAFGDAVATAKALAKAGRLVTFGIVPTSPEPAYGYIERGDALGDGAYSVRKFVEKPYLELAQQYVDSGTFLWNSGMFCLQASVAADAFKRLAPQIWEAAERCWAATKRPPSAAMVELDAATLADAPDISFDYAVMEQARQVAVVQAKFDWNDIGSWSSVSELTRPDATGNRSIGETVLIDAKNCYIQSDSRIVAGVGIENLFIIDTPDALLVADRERSQDVKRVVEQLKLRKHEAVKIHRKVTRPWGTYTLLEEGSGFKIKRIVVKPGHTLSLQMHHHRSEHWVVVSGAAKVINGEEESLVAKNESTFIPAGHKHRVENPGVIDLVMIEVQSGDYLGEDDIVRFEDSYGRA